MKNLETKIPPIFIVLVLGALMWAAKKMTPVLHNTTWHIAVACLVFLVGVGVAVSGAVIFKLEKTTVNPTKPDTASHLVTQGIFQFTRNPMYLGMLFTLIAWGIYLFAPINILFVIVFVFYMNHFQIRPEERAMRKLFGEEFEQYSRKVRRWI